MAFRELGNVPEFEFTPEVDELEHLSSMAGIKSLDHSVVLRLSATLRIVMEEFTAENLALAIGGTVTQNTAGQDEVDILSQGVTAAKVKFVGTNDIGQKATWVFSRIQFVPSAAINPISDEWMQFEVTGKAVRVAGSFGTVTFDDQSTAGDDPPDILNYTIGKGIVSIEIIP